MIEENREFLTFVLDGEEFGLNILAVQEIRVWSPVTDIPNTPDYIKGVINLRGVIVPIIDLRKRFNKKPADHTSDNVFIILKDKSIENSVVVGVFVDRVSDVYNLSASSIKPSPDFGRDIDSQFIDGMATVDEKIIVLLDTMKLLDVRELYQLSGDLNKLVS